MNDVLAQRGQGGSRTGRPTNLSVPFRGNLSDSARAAAQRERAAMRDAEESDLAKAKAGDRAAKYQLRKRLGEDAEYKQASQGKKDAIFAKLEEDLDEKRFRARKSGKLSQLLTMAFYLHIIAEWLEKALATVHAKWDEIELKVDMRNHEKVLGKRKHSEVEEDHTVYLARSAKHLFGVGGALQSVMRKEYKRGLKNLQTNSFESQAAKDQWIAWRDELEPEELAMLTSNEWV